MTPAADLGLFCIVISAMWIALHFGVRIALAPFLNILIKDRSVEVSFTAIKLSEVKNSANCSLPKLKKTAK
jgi:hypothetical protein